MMLFFYFLIIIFVCYWETWIHFGMDKYEKIVQQIMRVQVVARLPQGLKSTFLEEKNFFIPQASSEPLQFKNFDFCHEANSASSPKVNFFLADFSVLVTVCCGSYFKMKINSLKSILF